MGYQALLFCPDEKTARTVTQVLSELEFTVESCMEPFAAVKQLMGGHFDAVVVDCDNEQNASLLFKSARNSASNQASLAVAVVEGQAGVAKAFRIGANLVLTKPINVEQAKGTLRVARGLLRKGEPAKGAAPAAAATAAVKSPAANVSAAVKPVSQAPAAVSRPPLGSPVKPAPERAAWPVPQAAPAASAAPAMQDPSTVDARISETGLQATPPRATEVPATRVSRPPASVASANFGSSAGAGAASAPAPARWVEHTPATESVHMAATMESASVVEAPAAPVAEAKAESHAVAEVPAPSFTFGGANAPAESSGGSKKILLGVAAVVLVAAGLYIAWTQFGGKTSAPSTGAVPASSSSSSASQPRPAKTTPATSSAPASSSAPSTPDIYVDSQPESQPSSTDDAPATSKHTAAAHGTAATKPSISGASTATKPVEEPAEQPIVVKNGAGARPQTKPATADAPAPAMTGIAAPGSGGSLSNLISGGSSAPKPVLQTLSVSQGVSQGLIVKRVQPTYPSTALHMRIEGAVQLMATISKGGDITAVKVLSGEPLLTRAAAEAVKQWKYKPYLLNGEPVEIQTEITVNFKLPR
jgi:TonB family protein